MPFRTGLGLVIALVLVPQALLAQDRADRYVQQQMEQYQIPGLTLAVVRNGEVVKLKGYGLANIEFDIPTAPETVFQIYSVTKVFAGIAALALVEDGKLSLDTPVTDVIATLPAAWRSIRVRHLLTHTSGLPELSDNPRFAALPEEQRRSVTPDQMLVFAAEVPLRSQPGEKVAYHRFAYTLLGSIVERIAQKPFPAFLQERVFAPLGMTSTRFGDVEAIVKRRATAYNRGAEGLRTSYYLFGFGNPGAGLNSSAADLAKLMLALDAGKLLTRRSLDAMWTPVMLNDGARLNYALGWTSGLYKGRNVVGHEGGGAAWVAHFPAERLSIVILCNLNGARADEMQYGIADLYLTPPPQ